MPYPDYSSLPQYANILHLWKLDELSGTRSDFIATCHLTDNNTVLYGTGKISNAADFESATSEYLSATAASSSDMNFTSSNFSISFWIKPESLTADKGFLSRGGASLDGYWVSIFYANKYIRLSLAQSGANQFIYSNNNIVATDTWTHITIVRNGTTGYIYKNGADDTSASDILVNPTTCARELNIGRYQYTGSAYIDDLVDELIVWNVALTPTEVSTLYNWYSKAGFSGAISFTGTAIKKPKKLLTGTISFTGILSTKAKKLLAGAITFIGTLQKLPKKLLTGAISFTGVLSKNFKKLLTGSISFTGTLSTNFKKILTGNISFIGTLSSIKNKIDDVWKFIVKRTTTWTGQDKEDTAWTTQSKEDTSWTKKSKETTTWSAIEKETTDWTTT